MDTYGVSLGATVLLPFRVHSLNKVHRGEFSNVIAEIAANAHRKLWGKT